MIFGKLLIREFIEPATKTTAIETGTILFYKFTELDSLFFLFYKTIFSKVLRQKDDNLIWN